MRRKPWPPSLNRVQDVSLPEPWHISITVVDDGSSADFAEILEETIANRPVDLIRHNHNRGKGAALRTGFDAVLQPRGRMRCRGGPRC